MAAGSQTPLGNNSAAVPPKSLTVQAGALMIAKIIAFAFTFFIPVVLTRVLDLREFGHYKQLFLVLTTAQAILPLGFGVSTFYFFSREPDAAKRSSIAANAVLFHAAVGALGAGILLAWPNVLTYLFGSADLLPYARFLSLILFLSVVGSLIECIATANQDVVFSTVFIISTQLTKAIAMICGALWTRSLSGLLYAALLQVLIQFVVLMYYLHLRFPQFWRVPDLRMLQSQLTYSLPLGFAGLTYTLHNDLHNYFVSNVFGPVAFAIYSTGVAQLPLVALMRESVTSVLLGRVSQLQKEGRAADILVLTIQVMRKMALVYWPLYALLMIIARELIVLMYTDDFVSSVPIFRINLTGLPFLAIIQDPILRAYADHRFYLLTVRLGLFAALVIILTTSLAKIGLIGAVTVVVGLAFVERALLLTKVSRVLGMNRHDLPKFRPLMRIGAATAIAAAVAFAVRLMLLSQPVFIIVSGTSAAYVTAYAALVLRLDILEEDELNLFKSSWQRALHFLPLRRAGNPV